MPRITPIHLAPNGLENLPIAFGQDQQTSCHNIIMLGHADGHSKARKTDLEIHWIGELSGSKRFRYSEIVWLQVLRLNKFLGWQIVRMIECSG